MKTLFNENSERILIYTSVETLIDPDDMSVSHTVLNSLPIDSIVTDVAGESMIFETAGIISSDSKMLICESKFKNLLKLSHHLEIQGEEFVGFKKNGAMSIKRLNADYIRIYAYKEK